MPETPPAPERLYRDDARLLVFTAAVTRCVPEADGRFLVELDRTAFYPTGGGQPFDTGSLDGVPVVDVREEEDGRIAHVIESSHPLAGAIEGRVDAARREDHKQQHSGQHILSRAFVEVAGAATRSFHLGAASSTIDIDLPEADADRIRAASMRANEIIFGDAAVEVRHLPPDQAGALAADLGLARELALKPGDPIRLIRIGAFDESPCGGTHVGRTGEIGCVAVRSFERFKGGTRISFLCGGRVVSEVATLGAIVDQLGARLSAGPADLAGAVEKMAAQVVALRQELKTTSEALAEHEASALVQAGHQEAGHVIAIRLIEGRTADHLQRMAQKATMAAGVIVLLASADPATGQAHFVFARSKAGTPPDLKMGELLTAALLPLGGKGGGSPTLARGGGVAAMQAQAVLDAAGASLRLRLGP